MTFAIVMMTFVCECLSVFVVTLVVIRLSIVLRVLSALVCMFSTLRPVLPEQAMKLWLMILDVFLILASPSMTSLFA